MNNHCTPLLLDAPDTNGPEASDPSPERIRAECLRIQKTWSEEERRRRAGLRNLWLEIWGAA